MVVGTIQIYIEREFRKSGKSVIVTAEMRTEWEIRKDSELVVKTI